MIGPSGALPAGAADALRPLIDGTATTTTALRGAVDAAFAAVAWAPDRRMPPRADELSAAARALALALVDRDDLDLDRFGVPRVRRRAWLGLDPPGALEQWVEVETLGERRDEPLWRALRIAEDARDERAKRGVLASLPLDRRLRAFGEVNAHPRHTPYGLSREALFDWREIDNLKTLRDEGAAWAPAFADHLLSMDRAARVEAVLWPTFLALVRAKIPIEARWDALLPIGFGAYQALTDECVRAISWERRTAAIVAALEGDAYVVEKGLPLLAQYPSRELAEVILRAASGERRARVLPELRAIARGHPVVRAAIEPVPAPPLPKTKAKTKTKKRKTKKKAAPAPPPPRTTTKKKKKKKKAPTKKRLVAKKKRSVRGKRLSRRTTK